MSNQPPAPIITCGRFPGPDEDSDSLTVNDKDFYNGTCKETAIELDDETEDEDDEEQDSTEYSVLQPTQEELARHDEWNGIWVSLLERTKDPAERKILQKKWSGQRRKRCGDFEKKYPNAEVPKCLQLKKVSGGTAEERRLRKKAQTLESKRNPDPRPYIKREATGGNDTNQGASKKHKTESGNDPDATEGSAAPAVTGPDLSKMTAADLIVQLQGGTVDAGLREMLQGALSSCDKSPRTFNTPSSSSDRVVNMVDMVCAEMNEGTVDQFLLDKLKRYIARREQLVANSSSATATKAGSAKQTSGTTMTAERARHMAVCGSSDKVVFMMDMVGMEIRQGTVCNTLLKKLKSDITESEKRTDDYFPQKENLEDITLQELCDQIQLKKSWNGDAWDGVRNAIHKGFRQAKNEYSWAQENGFYAKRNSLVDAWYRERRLPLPEGNTPELLYDIDQLDGKWWNVWNDAQISLTLARSFREEREARSGNNSEADFDDDKDPRKDDDSVKVVT